MQCPKCNKEIVDDSVFCSGCGTRVVSGESEVSKVKKRKTINKRLIIIVAVSIIVMGCLGGLFYYSSTPTAKYKIAENAFNKGDYEKAVHYYTAAGNYEDAQQKLVVSQKAYSYSQALEKLAEKDYENAAILFKEADDYEDANDKILEIAKVFVDCKEYETAVKMYSYAKNWSTDANALYANGVVDFENGKYKEASNDFKKAGSILDAADKYIEAEYMYAMEELNAKRYENAITSFRTIKDYKDASTMINACNLMIAKGKMDTGYLNTAKTELEKLPSDFAYGTVKVSDLLEKLNQNSKWLSISGKWSNTSGKATTECEARRYSYTGGTWSSTFDEGDYVIDIKCMLNADGSINVSGTGTIFVFTDWSTIQAGLEYNRSYSINFNKKLNDSDFGKAISINEYTTITFGKDKLVLNYTFEDDNSSASFIYTHKTSVTYGKKAKSY